MSGVLLCLRSERGPSVAIEAVVDSNPLLAVHPCVCNLCNGKTEKVTVAHVLTSAAVQQHIQSAQADDLLASIRNVNWDFKNPRRIPSRVKKVCIPALKTLNKKP